MTLPMPRHAHIGLARIGGARRHYKAKVTAFRGEYPPQQDRRRARSWA